MGFVTSWFSFLGGQMFENPCLHGSHRKYMWLASNPVSVSKNMVHIRFAGQITTFAGVSPASSSHFIHQFLGLAAQAVAAGSTHSLLISEGKVYGMGDNCHGQLGLGSSVAVEVRIRRWWFTSGEKIAR